MLIQIALYILEHAHAGAIYWDILKHRLSYTEICLRTGVKYRDMLTMRAMYWDIGVMYRDVFTYRCNLQCCHTCVRYRDMCSHMWRIHTGVTFSYAFARKCLRGTYQNTGVIQLSRGTTLRDVHVNECPYVIRTSMKKTRQNSSVFPVFNWAFYFYLFTFHVRI